MAGDDKNDKKIDAPAAKKSEDDLDLDDDLAEAMDGQGGADAATNIDQLIAIEDPTFSEQLKDISADDFKGVVISTENSSDEINENEKTPTAFRSYVTNLPKEYKFKFYISLGILALMTPIAIMIYMGMLLPKFDFPFIVSMDEISKDVHTYEADSPEVPLFDDFRSKAFTYEIAKATINLKSRDGDPAFGDFEFFLNLRDEELSPLIDEKLGAIREIIQSTIGETTTEDLQTPLGKEKVKKVLRHRINEMLQQNAVLGVFYRSVLLNN